MIWYSDASSSAVTLISLINRFLNPFLLKLLNIEENDTDFKDIYDYVEKKFSNDDHSLFLEKIKITKKELFIVKENRKEWKDMIMPGVYGKTIQGNMESINKYISKHSTRLETWKNISEVKKYKIVTYYNSKTWEYLKKIGFDLKKYEEVCKNEWRKNKEINWLSHVNLPVINCVYKTSSRDELIKKLNKQNHLLKYSISPFQTLEIKKKLNILKKKLKKMKKCSLKEDLLAILTKKYTWD